MTDNILTEIMESRKKSVAEGFDFLDGIEPLKRDIQVESLCVTIRKTIGIPIISEIKPASPSLGEIKAQIDVPSVAREMEIGGAVGLSVLTEPKYFKGSFENLRLAVESTKLPCLMKDFVIDEVQFQIAEKLGATNILIIIAFGNLEMMCELSKEYNIEPLFEIHDAEEIEDLKQLIEIGFEPKLVGVNNRNLNTMKIDLNNSRKVIPIIKEEFGSDVMVISESGVNRYDDIQYLRLSRADAFLIGSSIMQSNDIKRKIRSLRGIE